MALSTINKGASAYPKEFFSAYPFGLQDQWASHGELSKEHLGGKGYGLRLMCDQGLPVPPGFTFPPALCLPVLADPSLMGGLEESMVKGMQALVKHFGYMPLLSVRSGARVSLPGMCGTILNVGLTSTTLPDWKKRIGERAALDSYRRLIQMYASTAMGLPIKLFDDCLVSLKTYHQVENDSDLDVYGLTLLIERFLEIVKDAGKVFPDTTLEQVMGAASAVFGSWNNHHAISFRKINGIPDAWGTSVTVQAMVFGNLNAKSATAVFFTRNPDSGERTPYGDWLPMAQGEDVVAAKGKTENVAGFASWAGPELAVEVFGTMQALETHFRYVQDIELTVQDGKLYVLQTRSGKMSARATFRATYDMCKEGLITKEEAFERVSAAQLYTVMQDAIDPAFTVPPAFTGIAAGGGIVSGVAMFTSDNAVKCTQACILVRSQTDPEDILGMEASLGILTATGGLTSHAAVVARGMDKSCIVGATAMKVNEYDHTVSLGSPAGFCFKEGDVITLDGATGRVWVGVKVPVIQGGASADVRELCGWGASTPADRLELSPTMTGDDLTSLVAATTADVIYADTALLEGGDCFTVNDSTPKRLAFLGHALGSFKGSRIVIDLKQRSEGYSEADRAIDAMFGLLPNTDWPNMLLLRKCHALKQWPDALISRCSLVLPSVELGSTCDMVLKALLVIGFKEVKPLATVGDMMDSAVTLLITKEAIKKLFGSQADYDNVKSALEMKFGKNLNPALPVASYWYEALTSKE